MINYLEIINQFIKPTSFTYKIYLIHVVLVTKKALEIACRLNLSLDQKNFIEEAGMLHDIGVIKVKSSKMDCQGDFPYVCHGVEGGKILKSLNLKPHALVAERHIGVGVSKEDIESQNLPLPLRDMTPQTLEEKIITYADLFFSKRENILWQEEKPEKIIMELRKYGQNKEKIFLAWQHEFEF